MLIDDRAPPPGPGDRPVLQPNWRLVGWIAVAIGVFVAAGKTNGLVAYVLVCAAFYATARAAVELLDYGGGLREWRQ